MSAPRDLSSPSCVEVAATKEAPAALMNCSSAVPTPPLPPSTSTRSPARMRPFSREIRNACPALLARAAPSTAESFCGLAAARAGSARAYSASPPSAIPDHVATTSSPTWNWGRAWRGSTSTTVPDTSNAGTKGNPGLRTRSASPWSVRQSPGLSAHACTRRSILPLPGSSCGRGWSGARLSTAAAGPNALASTARIVLGGDGRMLLFGSSAIWSQRQPAGVLPGWVCPFVPTTDSAVAAAAAAGVKLSPCRNTDR
mmetsp:Transcript_2623/g.6539  ORF Transcript_2623/g.6539 Transcript_2623/m.6539 type:complete len:256 (+) Transcript_2623:337-1104(+)